VNETVPKTVLSHSLFFYDGMLGFNMERQEEEVFYHVIITFILIDKRILSTRSLLLHLSQKSAKELFSCLFKHQKKY